MRVKDRIYKIALRSRRGEGAGGLPSPHVFAAAAGRPGGSAVVDVPAYDVDDNVHVAVTPDDDPAADLQRSHGRFLYFATDEIEPIEFATNDEMGREDPA